MKNIVKEERALDALISFTLLPTSKSIEESIGKM